MEIRGFKSFANYTKIKFDSQITAVVGPNGSGKSNISDAIKWVLGETSAKSIRGDSMEDVIFSGSEDKNRMNFADVKLNFSNEDKKIDFFGDYIQIERRIYRDKESEYRINKKKVRLRDVKELFLNTGIGKDGYSIISQGKIENIINSSPIERRNIFEEASGISKHKFRKEESIKNLQKLNEKLNEIENDFNYRKKELNILKSHAQNQRNKESLISEYDKLSFAYYKNNTLKIYNKIEKIEKDIKLLNDALFEIKNNISNKEKEIIPIKKNLSEFENTKNDLELKINDINNELNNFINKNELLKQKIEFSKKDKNRILIDLDKNKIRYDEIEKLLVSLKNDINKKELEIKKYNSNKEKYLLINEKINNDITILSSEVNFKEKKLKEINLVLYEHKVKKETNSNVLKSYESDVTKYKELEKENKEFINKLTNIKEKIENKNIFINKYNLKIKNLKDDITETENKLKKLTTKQFNLKLKLKEEIAKYRIFANLSKNNDGYSYSVKKFLEIKEIKNMYCSTLADMITVKKGYEQVIETLLYGVLQNIITETTVNAKELVKYIKEHNLGRITFLPIDNIKPKVKIKPKFSEVISMAEELIVYDDKIYNIISHFLGDTVVVKNIDDAIKLSKKINGYKIITLSSDVITTWGSITGGKINKKPNTQIINRKKNLDDKKRLLLNLDSELKNINSKINFYEEELISNKDRLVEFEKELENLNSTNKNYSFELENLNSQIDKNKAKLEILSDSINKKVYINKDNIDVEKNKKEQSNLTEEINSINIKLNSLKSEYLENENKINVCKNTVDSFERDINIILNKLNEKKADKKTLSENSFTTKKLLESINDDLLKYENSQNKNSDIIDEFEKEEIEQNKKLENIKEKINNLRNIDKDISKNLDNFKNEAHLKELEIVKKDYEYKNLKTKLSDIKNDLIEKTFESIDELESKFSSFKISVEKNDLEILLKKINSIGFYENDSIEKYEKAKIEFEELTKQREDLLKSKNEIIEMIKKLDLMMKNDFKKNFEIIDKNFRRIFKKLFLGGEAKLELVDDDVLNSGIEIKVKPKGKTNRNINLLSGGEKSLTAVSLLFAFFETNPSPFCILDEVDAALDEINISRYISYLKELSKNTQFVVITHRQITMQLADMIYGVSMEEKGVSKIFCIDFRQ
ncbi:MAG: chromosome segregation protein SMC [Peptoniphilaceae bacterium]|nr:chromosome segregation protein SMC [Peptoniphilaceae bacterium]